MSGLPTLSFFVYFVYFVVVLCLGTKRRARGWSDRGMLVVKGKSE